MASKNFTATIEVSKSAEEVFKCLTDVTKWWSQDFEGKSKYLGDEFTIHHPEQHYSKQKLIEVMPGKKMVWLVMEGTLYWLQGNKHEWVNTKMIFEITTTGNNTVVYFTHEGLTPEKECYPMCKKGWTTVIKSWLPHFITFGTSSPEMESVAELRNQILANTKSK